MDIICLSHLQWEETLFQRPQQLMLRMARQVRVLYVASCATRAYAQARLKGNARFWQGQVNENLHYYNVPFPPLSRRFPALRQWHVKRMVSRAKSLAAKHKFQDAALWLYYPSFIDYIDQIPHSRLVYDCMDQFRGFVCSDAQIEEQEQRLLAKADVVFTGGRSLQRSKEGINPATYCFPSGVDVDHFRKAALEETPVPADIASLPHPILGYFGAIDERIDTALIEALCRHRPDASIVFIGPMVGQVNLPRECANFHDLGKKNYSELPGYLKAFDVCLMPFVQSELTRHISPTKTPEYLAGGKPVVSTPVPDVIADYADVVHVAEDTPRFLQAVDAVLRDGYASNALQEKARAQSWDAIAAEMMKLAGIWEEDSCHTIQ